jgi:small-conductance mechanosensitive channel
MLQQILLHNYFNNRVLDYLTFILILIAGIIAIQIIKKYVLKSLAKWAQNSKNPLDDFIIATVKRNILPLLYYGVFYVSTQSLTLARIIVNGIRNLGVAFAVYFGIKLLMEVVVYLLESVWLNDEENSSKIKAIKGIVAVVKVLLWGFALVLFLDNIGVKISALVAGLGIGGIAVALAAQTILGDLFSYFIIFFDRPFELGDSIVIDSFKGTVEYIGIKTTRLRSVDGEQVIISNKDLTNSKLRNFKRMERRRVAFTIGVAYETKLELLKEIPGIISDIISNIDKTELDRVHFASYGDYSLGFDVVYYVLDKDYKRYMDIQQEINFKIKEEFEKRSIRFAYPTQNIYINSNNHS